MYRCLNEGGAEYYGSGAYLSPFGGKINEVPADATALPHRDAAFSSLFETAWLSPEDDERQLSWVRRLYREVHADTGGVPVPGAPQ